MVDVCVNVGSVIESRVRDRMTLRAIAAKYGVSKTYIENVLKRRGITGTLQYPELDDSTTFDKPDDVIASKLGIRVSRVANARRRLSVKKHRYVNFSSRRKTFALEVFDKLPGTNFELVADFIKENLNETMSTKVIAFYVEMRDDQDLYSRVSRTNAKIILKKAITSIVVNELIEKGALME